MSQFLAVMEKTVVDQAYVPPELDEDNVEVTPEVPLITHQEIERCYVEDAPATVAMILAAQADDPDAYKNLTMYSLKFNPTTLRPTIKTVRIKSRGSAPAKELVTIEDVDGTELGSGEL